MPWLPVPNVVHADRCPTESNPAPYHRQNTQPGSTCLELSTSTCCMNTFGQPVQAHSSKNIEETRYHLSKRPDAYHAGTQPCPTMPNRPDARPVQCWLCWCPTEPTPAKTHNLNSFLWTSGLHPNQQAHRRHRISTKGIVCWKFGKPQGRTSFPASMKLKHVSSVFAKHESIHIGLRFGIWGVFAQLSKPDVTERGPKKGAKKRRRMRERALEGWHKRRKQVRPWFCTHPSPSKQRPESTKLALDESLLGRCWDQNWWRELL